MIDFDKIARVANEANRAYCAAIGEKPPPTWANATDEHKKSIVAAVEYRFRNPGKSPGRIRPDFDEMPEEDRFKDALFCAIVDRMFLGAAEVALSRATMGEIPVEAVRRLGCKDVVLMVQHHDGSCGISGHGLNHMEINNLLSLGIHLNLSDHDRQVREGAAGEKARHQAERLINEEAGRA